MDTVLHTPGAHRVADINRRTAEGYSSGEDVVGKQVPYGTKPKPLRPASRVDPLAALRHE